MALLTYLNRKGLDFSLTNGKVSVPVASLQVIRTALCHIIATIDVWSSG